MCFLIYFHTTKCLIVWFHALYISIQDYSKVIHMIKHMLKGLNIICFIVIFADVKALIHFCIDFCLCGLISGESVG